jgi:hypothetical protein
MMEGDRILISESQFFSLSEKVKQLAHVSCAARCGPHFCSPSAELQIARHHLYGYTGVLTIFTSK